MPAELSHLPDLPYDPGALEPHISARIMELHHGKHHAVYAAARHRPVGARLYLQYENRKADFVEAIWNVVDWQDVTSCYEAARAAHRARLRASG